MQFLILTIRYVISLCTFSNYQCSEVYSANHSFTSTVIERISINKLLINLMNIWIIVRTERKSFRTRISIATGWYLLCTKSGFLSGSPLSWYHQNSSCVLSRKLMFRSFTHFIYSTYNLWQKENLFWRTTKRYAEFLEFWASDTDCFEWGIVDSCPFYSGLIIIKYAVY